MHVTILSNSCATREDALVRDGLASQVDLNLDLDLTRALSGVLEPHVAPLIQEARAHIKGGTQSEL
jgi:hypothetical protein